jgi:hypothetical protein
MVAVAPAITSEALMQGKTAECPWSNAKDNGEALGRPEERNGSTVERKRGRCSGLSGDESRCKVDVMLKREVLNERTGCAARGIWIAFVVDD